MGVERCDYVMIAAKFNFDEFEQAIASNSDITDKYDDNSYESDITACNGLTMVRDGMNGEYVFFGEVIAKNIECSDGFDPINVDEFIKEEDRVERWIKDEMKTLGIKLPFKVSVYIFTHWH